MEFRSGGKIQGHVHGALIGHDPHLKRMFRGRAAGPSCVQGRVNDGQVHRHPAFAHRAERRHVKRDQGGR